MSPQNKKNKNIKRLKTQKAGTNQEDRKESHKTERDQKLTSCVSDICIVV